MPALGACLVDPRSGRSDPTRRGVKDVVCGPMCAGITADLLRIPWWDSKPLGSRMSLLTATQGPFLPHVL